MSSSALALTNHLLVAAPSLQQEPFARGVALICHLEWTCAGEGTTELWAARRIAQIGLVLADEQVAGSGSHQSHTSKAGETGCLALIGITAAPQASGVNKDAEVAAAIAAAYARSGN